MYSQLQVYPRVYGGTSCAGDSQGSESGLSPRVRGNRNTAKDTAGRVRSIPACTGEPGFAARLGPKVTVYPRVYGGTTSAGP